MDRKVAAICDELNKTIAAWSSNHDENKKISNDKLYTALEEKLEQHPPAEVLAFARYVKSAQEDAAKNPESKKVLLDITIIYLSKHGYRVELAHVLADHCPNRISTHTDIEYFLALQDPHILADPILVLCEAYDQSHNAAARHQISAALTRGFQALIPLPSDENKIVQDCRTWYAEHRNGIEVNLDYGNNALLAFNPYAKTALFKFKSSAR